MIKPTDRRGDEPARGAADGDQVPDDQDAGDQEQDCRDDRVHSFLKNVIRRYLELFNEKCLLSKTRLFVYFYRGVAVVAFGNRFRF